MGVLSRSLSSRLIPPYIEILTIRSFDLLQIKRLVRGAHPYKLHSSYKLSEITVYGRLKSKSNIYVTAARRYWPTTSHT